MINKICKKFLILKQILIVFIISFLFHIQEIYAEIIEQIHSDDLYIVSLNGGLKRLRAEGFVTSEHPPWPLDVPLDWGADPFKNRNWQFQLHCWRMIDQFLIEYFKTGEISLIEEALVFVEDWHDYHFIKNKSATFSWEDMSTGIRALRLAFFLDVIRRNIINVDKNLKEKLFFLIKQHVNKLKEEKWISKKNHGIFQIAGLHLLCMVAADNPVCNNTKSFMERHFKEILGEQFTEEGVHTEGAPYYHLYISELLNTRLKAARQLSSVDNVLEKAELVKPWLLFPNKVIARIGDSTGTRENVSFESLNTIKPTCIQKNKCFLIGDFTASGYAIIRSIPDNKDQSMIFVTGMAHNTGHKHADDLSFELFEFGRFIFIDSGSYTSQFDSMRKYVLSSAAHNTISIQDTILPINSEKLPISSPKSVETKNNKYEKVAWKDIIDQVNTVEMSGSFLRSIKAKNNEFEIHGKVDRKNLFSQERYISYIPGEKLRIEDTLVSPTEHNYVSSLHLALDLHPVLVGSNTFIVDLDNGSLEAKLLSKDCKISTARGQKNPILGWTTVKYLEMVPITVVRAICPGKNRKIIWEIEFHRQKAI